MPLAASIRTPFFYHSSMQLRAISLLTLLAISAGVACGGDDDASPTATREATRSSETPARSPTTAATSAPTTQANIDDDFRAFARDMDAQARMRDARFFRERMKTVRVDCSTAPDANQIGGPICETPDAMYDGFATGAWRSEGSIVPADAAAAAFQALFDAELPAENDEFGNGAAQVYALNVREGAYKAVITALVARPPDFAGEGPLRAVLSTSWVREGDRWMMEGPLIIAYVLAEDFLEPTSESGYDAWERFTSD